jgi:hypothetical protein
MIVLFFLVLFVYRIQQAVAEVECLPGPRRE